MRTTITLDEDVARAVEELRRERGLGVSAAVNEMARQGLAQRRSARTTFTQTVSDTGPFKVPVDDVAAVLEILEGPAHRA